MPSTRPSHRSTALWSLLATAFVASGCTTAWETLRPPDFGPDSGQPDTGLWLLDQDEDGFRPADGDCDDENPDAYPGNDEVCDEVDNDCNDLIDDDAVDAATWYSDDDEDGYGAAGTETEACTAPDNSAEVAGDCDDTDPNVNPDASETWYDGVDQDCDGNDDDQDEDGYAAEMAGGLDCDDTDEAIHPGAEDGAGADAKGDPERSKAGSALVDDDCDDTVDEDAVLSGDLVVTEINAYSSAGGSDPGLRSTKGNWFEVYNTSPLTLNLANWSFAACDHAPADGVGFDSGDPEWSYCDEIRWFAVDPGERVILAPQGYAVFCRDDTVFDDPSDCTYSYSDPSLTGKAPNDVPYAEHDFEFRPANGLLGIALTASSPSTNALIDDVGWYYHASLDRWPYELNTSMCLLESIEPHTTANDLLANWAAFEGAQTWATDPTDNLGTPSSANQNCE